MTRKRLTDERIIAVLRKGEAGMKSGGLARGHCLSETAIAERKARYIGISVSCDKRCGEGDARTG